MNINSWLDRKLFIFIINSQRYPNMASVSSDTENSSASTSPSQSQNDPVAPHIDDETLQFLLEHRGISSNFIDAWGQHKSIGKDVQMKLLLSMGYPVNNQDALQDALELEQREFWVNPLPLVVIDFVNAELFIDVKVPIQCASDKHIIKVTFESGKTKSISIVPVDHELISVEVIDELEWQAYRIAIKPISILGYHRINLIHAGKTIAKCPLIICPDKCFVPESIKNGERFWGVNIQLFCLRSESNWGVGDFSDLNSLVKHSALLGMNFIGVNPLHSLYPAQANDCSPYSPSSRSWLNFIYIDVDSVCGSQSHQYTQWRSSETIESELKELRALDSVDYERVSEIKLKGLELAFSSFIENANSDDNKRFEEFVKRGSISLKTQATFDALQSDLKKQGKPYWGWPVFPEELQDIQSDKVKGFAKQNARLIQFYMFLQWQADEQLSNANHAATSAGMKLGLYKDLAVGVSLGGSEVWGNQDLYCTDISVGAPPDNLGPLGQKWGLPPMDPNELIKQGYQPFIDLCRANMKACGALRIDHVMALLRLWWVHDSDEATKGAYVNYPIDDLLAILSLESTRHQCMVVGEDLGTVPASIREKLAAKSVYSYRVFFFEQAPDGGFYSPAHYPEQSLATLCTHDMPTLRGFWDCHDLSLGEELGLYPDKQALQHLFDVRHANKQQILNSLHGHHVIDESISRDVNYVGMTPELNYAIHKHMASGSSHLLTFQLEDWLQMEHPVNVPGTSTEYPNWRRKLSRTLDDIFNDKDIIDLAAQLNQLRKK